MNEARELLRMAKQLVGFVFDKASLLEDWTVELGNALPGERELDRFDKMKMWVQSTRVKKNSDDQWVAMSVLRDGTKIVGIKPWNMEYDRKTGQNERREWSGRWIVFINGRKVRDERDSRMSLQNALEDILLNQVDKYAASLKRRDWYYQYSDDHRYWVSGERHTKDLQAMYSKMSPPEQRAAYEIFLKEMPADWTKPSFSQFEGA